MFKLESDSCDAVTHNTGSNKRMFRTVLWVPFVLIYVHEDHEVKDTIPNYF